MMSSIRKCFSQPLLVLTWAVALAVTSAVVQAESSGLLLTGITVVDTRTGTLTPDRAVLIDGDRITAIAPLAELAGNDAVQVVNAQGKYLVPGYLDMHAHAAELDVAALHARLMLGNGITGYRQMSGSEQLLQLRREGKLAPFPDAPALLAMPGDVLVGQIAKDPDGARAEVRRQQAAGADFIKVADLKPDSYMAALNEATRLGLPYAGHLPSTINLFDATDAGMHAIEHLGPRSSILLGCSTDEAILRREIAESPPGGVPILPDFLAWLLKPVINHMVERALTNPYIMSDEAEFIQMQHLVDTYSADKCRRLAEKLASTESWQVPTLIRVRTMELGDAPEYRNDPNLRYMPEQTRELWQSVSEDFSNDISAAGKQSLKQFFELQKKLVADFDRAGVKMLAGSDAGGGWLIPGFSLHQEFDLLEEAGVSPLKVLQMTTLNGAVFFNKEASMGTVEAGKEANLVVLDANPIDSVQNLHRIHAVIRNGNYYSHSALEALKNEP